MTDSFIKAIRTHIGIPPGTDRNKGREAPPGGAVGRRPLFVRTYATAFAEGGRFTYHVSFQPGDGIGTFDVLRPVPDPGGAAAWVGMGALVLRRWRGRCIR
jgi:hypothetical protein